MLLSTGQPRAEPDFNPSVPQGLRKGTGAEILDHAFLQPSLRLQRGLARFGDYMLRQAPLGINPHPDRPEKRGDAGAG